MDYKKQLSIIIPVYNTGIYLQKCLNSVIKAIDDTMEVIIINDGSTDNSEEIILKYLRKYKEKFIYYKKENGGLSDVKNYGLERAKGEYIIFLDSDDYIELDMYKEMLKVAKEHNSDLVICDINIVNENGSSQRVICNNPSRNTKFFQIIDTPLMASSVNKLVKKKLYEGLVFPKGMNNEDVSVTPILLARAKNIQIINVPYYNYFQRSGSIQNSRFDERRFVILETCKLAIDRSIDFNNNIKEQIKGSLYVHQILAIALYPIREQKFMYRYKLLKKYIRKAKNNFPDLLKNKYVIEMCTYDGKLNLIYKKSVIFMLKNDMYLMTCILFSIYNLLKKIYIEDNKK